MFKELFHENCLTFWLLKTTSEQQEARQQFKHLRAQTIRNDWERFFFLSDSHTWKTPLRLFQVPVRFYHSNTRSWLACVASVSVRCRNKERGTRVKDRAKNGALLALSLSLLRNQAKWKRLPHRLGHDYLNETKPLTQTRLYRIALVQEEVGFSRTEHCAIFIVTYPGMIILTSEVQRCSHLRIVLHIRLSTAS